MLKDYWSEHHDHRDGHPVDLRDARHLVWQANEECKRLESVREHSLGHAFPLLRQRRSQVHRSHVPDPDHERWKDHVASGSVKPPVREDKVLEHELGKLRWIQILHKRAKSFDKIGVNPPFSFQYKTSY